ncbi:MAG: hypothetical protein JW963_09170 [Anaerolineales bacterium]|nr:hypothetical protein [Anaerolineales bacterium]
MSWSFLSLDELGQRCEPHLRFAIEEVFEYTAQFVHTAPILPLEFLPLVSVSSSAPLP